MSGTVDRAVVVGGSIAGLLAACALTEAFTEVVVVDRDEIPVGPSARAGVPQGRHTHALLARGREVIEDLLPGITDELIALGACTGDVQDSVRFYVGPRPMARGTSGLRALAVSRPLLEWKIRQRVSALPGVTLIDRTAVLDLTFGADGTAVTGVVLAARDETQPDRVIEADLVVDASGRTARTGQWLARRGYAAAREERVRVDLAYVTRRFRRRPGDADGAVAVQHPSTPGIPRSGVLIAQEGDVWTASIGGYHGVRPPTELADFTAYARTLGATALAEVVSTLEPLDDGARYRFPANVRHRYEHVRHFPAGLLVTGDALCAFNPAFGQGMTVAALEALELRDALRDGRVNLAQRFFRRAGAHLDTPWTLVVRGAPPMPGSSVRPPVKTRLTNGYIRALQQAAVGDPVLARAFLRVAHMAAAPPSLMAPRYAARVLRSTLARHAGRPPAGAPPGRDTAVRIAQETGSPSS